MISLEVNIKRDGSHLVELIPAWVTTSRGAELRLGGCVSDVIAEAVDLRRKIEGSWHMPLDIKDQSDRADVLYALCQLLSDDCLDSPETVLDQATSTIERLGASPWVQDDLEERESLVCSFMFVAWRAARVLNLSRDAQRWESKYNQLFRSSLLWGVTEVALEVVGQSIQAAAEVIANGPEAVFQALLYLRDLGEAAPESAAQAAIQIFHSLEVDRLRLPQDLQAFFLGESARLAGTFLRFVGNLVEVERWAELSESHFQGDRNPTPALARVAFLRMAVAYAQSRWDFRAAERLEHLFAELGMEEDRIKCRIVWAASLKTAGRFLEALEVLEPLRRSRTQIRAGLYGWALLHSGDIHQICGDYQLALEELTEAGNLLREGRQSSGLADVNSMISGIYRSHGMIDEALLLLKSSFQEHTRLGLTSLVANDRILIAETYLAMGRPGEAELEIRAALPVLQEQAMIPEAVIAVSLLREAIRRQHRESKMPREIREHLRSKD